MANEELVDYVHERRKAGMSDNIIKTIMQNEGCTSALIEEVFKAAGDAPQKSLSVESQLKPAASPHSFAEPPAAVPPAPEKAPVPAAGNVARPVPQSIQAQAHPSPIPDVLPAEPLPSAPAPVSGENVTAPSPSAQNLTDQEKELEIHELISSSRVAGRSVSAAESVSRASRALPPSQISASMPAISASLVVAPTGRKGRKLLAILIVIVVLIIGASFTPFFSWVFSHISNIF